MSIGESERLHTELIRKKKRMKIRIFYACIQSNRELSVSAKCELQAALPLEIGNSIFRFVSHCIRDGHLL